MTAAWPGLAGEEPAVCREDGSDGCAGRALPFGRDKTHFELSVSMNGVAPPCRG